MQKIILLLCMVAIPWQFSTLVFAAGNDSIISQHIKEADGISGQNTNAGSGIKTGHIQDRAVTSSKIGFHKNVIVVAPSGGDFTNVYDALTSITDASATNPYIVKIMPGIYPMSVPPRNTVIYDYISVEGSGRTSTKLTCISDGSSSSLRPCISMSGPNTSISNLTVEITGDSAQGFDAVAFHLHGTPALSNLDIYAVNGNDDVGLKVLGGDAIVRDVTIYTGGTGIRTEAYGPSGRVRADNLKINGDDGGMPVRGIHVYNDGGIVEIRNSEIEGGLYSDTGVIKAAHSLLAGLVSESVKLVNCYDENYNPIPNR